MKRHSIIALLILSVLLTGCIQNGGVSDKAYLRAAVIANDNVTFSFFSDEDEVITVAANSLEEARQAAELRKGKKIFTGYTELIILSSSDNAEDLEFMLNEWKVSPSCMVATAAGRGSELLYTRNAQELEGAVKIAQEQNQIGRCDIVTVLGKLLGDNKSAEVPELSENGFSRKIQMK